MEQVVIVEVTSEGPGPASGVHLRRGDQHVMAHDIYWDPTALEDGELESIFADWVAMAATDPSIATWRQV